MLKFPVKYSDLSLVSLKSIFAVFLYQSSHGTKVRKRTQGSTNSARTEEVFERVSSAGIPPNPKALGRIKEIIEEEDRSSSEKRNELAREIISDPGLGLYYLSNLKSALDLEILPEDPLQPIHSMSVGQLKKMFNVSTSAISKHHMAQATPPQLLRLQHTYISSKSATDLSKQLCLEEGKAFSLVHVTQSAFNLMAWNYPSQFHKALLNKKRFNSSLEESLSSLVGVRTENIVNKIAKKIGLSTPILLDLQISQRAGNIEQSVLPADPSPLALARLGDLLARANDREHYPEATAQWEKIEKQLEERGLENPVNNIQQDIKNFIVELGGEHSLPYHMAIFQTQAAKNNLSSNPSQKYSQLNPHLKKLPDSLREICNKIYSNILEAQLSINALKILTEEFFPAIAVASGCLYLAKNQSLVFNPAFQFGKIKKERKEIFANSNDPVAQSIFCNLPQRFDMGHNQVSICGSLPDCKKQAILQLEFESVELKSLGEISFTVFNALSVMLVDVIGQRSES